MGKTEHADTRRRQRTGQVEGPSLTRGMRAARRAEADVPGVVGFLFIHTLPFWGKFQRRALTSWVFGDNGWSYRKVV